jgi:hypothetical protein
VQATEWRFENSLMSEQRQDLRNKTFLKGLITFSTGATTVECLVRELSTSAARLELSDAVSLPEKFSLFIPRKNKNYHATLVCRRNGAAEVFILDREAAPTDSAAAPEDPDPVGVLLLRRVSELEAENKVLRQLVLDQQAGAA